MLTLFWGSIAVVFIISCQIRMITRDGIGLPDLVSIVGPWGFVYFFVDDFWRFAYGLYGALIAILSPVDSNQDVVIGTARFITPMLVICCVYATLLLIGLIKVIHFKWFSHQHSGPNKMVRP